MKNNFLFLLIFNFSFLLSGNFKLKNSNSIFKVSSGSNFILDKSMNSIKGKVIKDSDAQISGLDIDFEEGTFQDDTTKVKMTGKLDFGDLKKIILNGGKTFQGKRGQVLQTINITGTDNIVEGVLFTVNDIELQDENTKVSFDIRNRLDANIKLNNGSLSLEEDLYFLDDKRLIGPGKIYLNGHKLSLGAKRLAWQEPIYFYSASDIELNSNTDLENVWSFSGYSILNGNNNLLCLCCDRAIEIKEESTLLLKDITLCGLSEDRIRCTSNNSKIIIQNAKIVLDGNFTFSIGALEFLNYVEFIGNDHKFIYESETTSTIRNNSFVCFSNNLTFSYAPKNDSRDLLVFEDFSSKMCLDSANFFVGKTGISLLNGELFVNGFSTLASQDTFFSYLSTGTPNGFNFGNSNYINDFALNILQNSILNLSRGSINYKNILDASLKMATYGSILGVASGAHFNYYQNLDLKKGKLVFEQGAWMRKVSDKVLVGTTEFNGKINFGLLN
ncbi:hypothetical protein GF385_04790 [Candidatus Dependentiae bacterium]|nr:hypothetical protein [Candidatus Dependentiae bacterium]